MSNNYTILDGVMVNNNVKFWLYVFTDEFWSIFKKQFSNSDIDYYLTFCDNRTQVNNMDVVIIYVKGKTAGIVSVIQSGSKITKNTKNVKIFDDINMNKYYICIDTYVIYSKPIKLVDIMDFMEDNIYTEVKFRNKYIKGNVSGKNIGNMFGIEIINAVSMYNNNDGNSKKNPKFVPRSESEPDIDIGSDYDSNDSPDVASETNNDSEETNNDEEEEDEETKLDNLENRWGIIPVLINTCKKFKFPTIEFNDEIDDYGNTPDDNVKCEYFKKHYKSCVNCEVTNNNSFELVVIIENCIMGYSQMKEIDGDVEKAFEYYYKGKKLNPFGEFITEMNMKIINIDDNGSVYDKSLLIVAAIPNKNDDVQKTITRYNNLSDNSDKSDNSDNDA